MKNNLVGSNDTIFVQKASGEKQAFLVDKLRQSLRNAGADAKAIEKIVADINDWIFDGATTKKIYARAFAILHREKTIASLRYRLKQAIMELGPTGYPFEHFVGQLFEKLGYSTIVGTMVEGYCISHEMDVVASQGKSQYLIECKYSKDQGKQVSIQVPLYVRSRVDDIIKKRRQMPAYEDFNFQPWVVTNTRFSADSMQYAKCSKMSLLGWDYPSGNGLKDLIENEKVYPITVLSQLTRKMKGELLEQGIVSCNQLLNRKDLIQSLGLNRKKYDALVIELKEIS